MGEAGERASSSYKQSGPRYSSLLEGQQGPRPRQLYVLTLFLAIRLDLFASVSARLHHDSGASSRYSDSRKQEPED